jgi:hypothetical protein
VTINRWCARSDKYGRYECTAAHLAKEDREAQRHIPTEASQAGRAGQCSCFPRFRGKRGRGKGSEGGHASRNGTTCSLLSIPVYLTVVLYCT